MKISNDIRIYIVEDDKIQAQVLIDKLLEFNPKYSITAFNNSKQLLSYFNTSYQKSKYSYLILDYFLQNTDDADSAEHELNGYDVIKLMGSQYPEIRIILFSAYESDGENEFKKMVGEPNVIEFVKKSEHAFSSLQNIFRFDYSQNSFLKKKRQFQWVLGAFVGLLVLSVLHFLFRFLSF